MVSAMDSCGLKHQIEQRRIVQGANFVVPPVMAQPPRQCFVNQPIEADKVHEPSAVQPHPYLCRIISNPDAY
jgi:hypothetical protein